MELENVEDKIYHGMTKNTFKKRYNAHMRSLRNRRDEHATALSTYVWSLKDRTAQFNIKWEIQARAKAYEPGMKRCNLCILEKNQNSRRRKKYAEFKMRAYV